MSGGGGGLFTRYVIGCYKKGSYWLEITRRVECDATMFLYSPRHRLWHEVYSLSNVFELSS
jgi:hypothetical protein